MVGDDLSLARVHVVHSDQERNVGTVCGTWKPACFRKKGAGTARAGPSSTKRTAVDARQRPGLWDFSLEARRSGPQSRSAILYSVVSSHDHAPILAMATDCCTTRPSCVQNIAHWCDTGHTRRHLPRRTDLPRRALQQPVHPAPDCGEQARQPPLGQQWLQQQLARQRGEQLAAPATGHVMGTH